MYKYDAYMCYADEDVNTVEEVVDRVERQGFRCFFGKREILLGRKIVATRTKRLEASEFIVVFLSRNFTKNVWCNHDIFLALQCKSSESYPQSIVPIYLDIDTEDVPQQLQQFQSIRYDDIEFFTKLIRRLEAGFTQRFRQLCATVAVPVYRQRVAIVGPSAVGKTHLAKRLIQEEYDEETDACTPGLKIYRHRCIVHKAGQSCWVKGKDDPEVQFVQQVAIGIQKPETFSQTVQAYLPPSAESRELEEDVWDATQQAQTAAPPGGSVSPDRIAEEIYSKNIDRRLLDKIESLAQGEPVHPEKQITIWDFAGQDVYYTTHQTFLSEQNIYLLVFRLDVDLDTKIPVYRGEKTVKEFIVYWLNSIHMHTVGKLKEEHKNVSPYVLLIGTHKDKLPSQEAAEEIIGNLRDYLDDKHELKKHIYLSFAISNLAKNEEFSKIKETIEHLCSLSSDNQMHPVRWFQLEMDLAKKSEQKPIIDIKELREIARSVGILEAELHEMFIPYHHRLGDVLHFKVDGLENVVILDPQWLADLFSKIMTPPVSKSGENRLDFLKLGLEKGELDEEVFDVYLQEKKMTKMKTEVIQLMEHFDLIFDISESVESPRMPPSQPGRRTFVVPCMLKYNDLADYKLSEIALKTSLFISFPHGFFPPGLFHRLIIRLFRKYKPYHCVNGIPDVSFDHASFRLEDKTSVLHLFTAEKDIELVIDNAERNIYFNARQTVEDELSYLQETYCPRMHFGYFIRVNDKRRKIPIEAETVLKTDAIRVCVEKSDEEIELKPYRVWFTTVEKKPRSPQSLEAGTNREEKVKVWPCTVELFEKKAYDTKRVYKNYTEWRGRAVIINNVSFDNEFSLDRKGTEVDVEYLKSLFRQLHYLVLKHDNLTAEAIDQLATREARTDHSAYSSFIMVILSHGGENTVIGTDGYHIGYDQILAHFEASRCPTLNGKPKMFFISACQGIQKAPLFNTEQAPPRPQDRETPEKADMILVTSTTRGDKSWRSTERGTFFIQCLVKELSERACDTQLLDILTQVNDSVSKMPTQDGCRQISSISTQTLRKSLYFWPGLYYPE